MPCRERPCRFFSNQVKLFQHGRINSSRSFRKRCGDNLRICEATHQAALWRTAGLLMDVMALSECGLMWSEPELCEERERAALEFYCVTNSVPR